MKIVKCAFNSLLHRESKSTIYLKASQWDDFNFETQFNVTFFDSSGNMFELGDVKIGYKGQTSPSLTRESMEDVYETGLPHHFFSLGQDVDYYEKINNLTEVTRDKLLTVLRDVVADNNALDNYKNENVFRTSLTRFISHSSLEGQFKRVLEGGERRIPYNFKYKNTPKDDGAKFELDFNVVPQSKPSSNIHILIGRNGIGKTTLLNGMISSLVDDSNVGQFIDMENNEKIGPRYFDRLISVSFSAFDPFEPPQDRDNDDESLSYSYIGLKANRSGTKQSKSTLKDFEDLSVEFSKSVKNILGLVQARKRWLDAITYLESDVNFSEMQLTSLANNLDPEDIEELAKKLFLRMSSGHAIVMLTITRLVELIQEKTLVIMDEPESHLHPPLLSAFIRALSSLLSERNGVSIIATHSPVVLQEMPKNSVWKLSRTRKTGKQERPERETFAENVGTLTREVFGLEVTKSGFHDLLDSSAREGKDFRAIIEEYGGQIGFEGKAVLMALLSKSKEREDS